MPIQIDIFDLRQNFIWAEDNTGKLYCISINRVLNHMNADERNRVEIEDGTTTDTHRECGHELTITEARLVMVDIEDYLTGKQYEAQAIKTLNEILNK